MKTKVSGSLAEDVVRKVRELDGKADPGPLETCLHLKNLSAHLAEIVEASIDVPLLVKGVVYSMAMAKRVTSEKEFTEMLNEKFVGDVGRWVRSLTSKVALLDMILNGNGYAEYNKDGVLVFRIAESKRKEIAGAFEALTKETGKKCTSMDGVPMSDPLELGKEVKPMAKKVGKKKKAVAKKTAKK